MPPSMVETKGDEKAWKRAKARAEKQGHAEDWPYVVAIYQSMAGKKGTAKGTFGPLVDVLSKATVGDNPDYYRPSGMEAVALVSGIRVHVEYFPGTARDGYTQHSGYGEVIGCTGADGEPYDCFIGQNKAAPTVYVIDQLDENGELDEHKAMVGFDSPEDAAHAYVMQLPTGKMGGMVAVSGAELARFLANTPMVSAEPFADLLAEAGVPSVKVWAPLSGLGPLASPSVRAANGGV